MRKTKLHVIVLAASGVIGIALPVSATDRQWSDATGGLFQDDLNWNGNIGPVNNDRAIFNLSDSGYTVTFNNNVSDVGLLIRNDTVTFDLKAPTSTFTFTTSDASPFRMGDTSGNIARFTLTNGTLDTSPSASSLLASNAGAQATMTITAGGVWNAGPSNIDVGNAGAGTLSILNGGRLSGTDMNIAALAGSTGSVSISGATSSITMTSVIQVGRAGQGSLTISSGASVSTNMNLGSLAGGSGTVTVTGLGSSLTTAAGSPAGLVIGASGAGTMTVSNGANLTSASLAMAQANDTIGSLLVSDANTNWNNSGAMTMGLGARTSSSLSILNGAQASTASAVIADLSTSVATVSVAGHNSLWSIAAGPTLGNRGSAHLVISDGATVAVTSNGSTIIGSQTSSSGDVNVSGPGSSFNVAVGTTVGGSGAGTLSVSDGALATAHTFLLASNSGSSALVTVSGPGSRLTAGGSNSMTMGSGAATVSVSDGGAISLFDGIQLGTTAGSKGTLRVSGAGSSLGSSSGTMTVGGGGQGSLIITEGGTVTTPSMNVATAAGARGDITLAGPGSSLSLTGTASIGASGNAASVSISDGASMNVGGTMTLATGSTLSADHGSLFLDKFSIQSSALGVLDDATLRTTATTAGTFTSFNSGELRLAGSGAARVSGGGIINSGLIDGNGWIDNQVSNGGEVRVSTGERLFFASAAGVSNDGRMTLLGGTLGFAALVNSNGLISGRGAIAANGGLSNGGQMQFSAGLTDVSGAITSAPNSKIIVSGGGTATFYSNVTMNSGSEFRISTASTAVFFGNVSGSNFFTGSGIKDFEGGSSALGPVSTTGSTVAQAPASISASFFRENALTVAGHVTIDSGGGTSHLNSLDIEPGGVLDLKNNSLVLENGNLQTITAQIRSGLNTGTGILSTAPGSPFRLGSMSNAGTIYSSFQGISGLNGDEVLIRYTRIGDLNLDGTVTISDFIDLASNFNHIGGATWQMGDVNYDGSVTISDFIDLASNFNQGVSGDASPISDRDATILADFAASHAPEPAIFNVVLASSLLMCRRSRKASR